MTQVFTFPSSIQGPLASALVCDIDSKLGGPCLQYLDSHVGEFDGVVVTNVFGMRGGALKTKATCILRCSYSYWISGQRSMCT